MRHIKQYTISMFQFPIGEMIAFTMKTVKCRVEDPSHKNYYRTRTVSCYADYCQNYIAHRCLLGVYTSRYFLSYQQNNLYKYQIQF